MSKPYRPTPKQRQLFERLAKEVRAHAAEYVGAVTWFATEFSIDAIDARYVAKMPAIARRVRKARLRAGWTDNTGRDSSGYMKRLLRATEWLIEIDDSALPKADRIEHYRRVILVAVLITDPDVLTEVSQIASALGVNCAHWPTTKALTVGSEEHELNRWWAREWVFDPRERKWSGFQPLAERALAAAKRAPRSVASASKRGNRRQSDRKASRTSTRTPTKHASAASAKSGATRAREPRLTVHHRRILRFMRDRKATGPEDMLNAKIIAREQFARGAKQINDTLARLVKVGFLKSERGPIGGYWITAHGIAALVASEDPGAANNSEQ
jgi:hypothetical protein